MPGDRAAVVAAARIFVVKTPGPGTDPAAAEPPSGEPQEPPPYPDPTESPPDTSAAAS